MLSCALNRVHAQAFPFFHVFNNVSTSLSGNFHSASQGQSIHCPFCPFVFFYNKFFQWSQRKKTNKQTTMTFPIYHLNQSSGQIKRNIQLILWHTYKHWLNFLFILFYLFVFGCVWSLLLHMAFSSCGEQGLLFVAVRWLLIVVVSLAVEHRL